MGLVPGNIRKMLKTPQTNQKNESFRSFIVFPMQKSPFYRRYTVYDIRMYTVYIGISHPQTLHHRQDHRRNDSSWPCPCGNRAASGWRGQWCGPQWVSPGRPRMPSLRTRFFTPIGNNHQTDLKGFSTPHSYSTKWWGSLRLAMEMMVFKVGSKSLWIHVKFVFQI